MAKTALLTGATEGIGLELARILAANHFDLVLVARNAAKLEKLTNDLTKDFSVKVGYLAMDLTLSIAPKAIFEFCVSNGFQVNYLINNAGVGDYGLFADSDWLRQKQMLDLNIDAVTQLCWIFIPYFLKNSSKSHILNISSTAAFVPGPRMAVYFASKAYIQSFTEALMAELNGTNISVIAFCPGPTQTQFAYNANIFQNSNQKDHSASKAYDVALMAFNSIENNKKIVVFGLVNRLFIAFTSILPRLWVVRLMKRKMGL